MDVERYEVAASRKCHWTIIWSNCSRKRHADEGLTVRGELSVRRCNNGCQKPPSSRTRAGHKEGFEIGLCSTHLNGYFLVALYQRLITNNQNRNPKHLTATPYNRIRRTDKPYH